MAQPTPSTGGAGSVPPRVFTGPSASQSELASLRVRTNGSFTPLTASALRGKVVLVDSGLHLPQLAAHTSLRARLHEKYRIKDGV